MIIKCNLQCQIKKYPKKKIGLSKKFLCNYLEAFITAKRRRNHLNSLRLCECKFIKYFSLALSLSFQIILNANTNKVHDVILYIIGGQKDVHKRLALIDTDIGPRGFFETVTRLKKT